MMSGRSPYRLFRCRLARRTELTPHMIRLTVSGDDLDRCGDTLLDQRIKVVLGEPETLAAIPDSDDWFTSLRAAASPVVLRTYTVAGLRPEVREIDIDFVSHGTAGPASQFALEAPLGTPLVLAAPDREVPGHESSGLAWRSGADRVLLVGDETALPAIANILRSLPPHASGDAVIEVPTGSDAQPLPTPDGVRLRWCPRDGAEPGAAVIPALIDVLAVGPTGATSAAAEDSDDPDAPLLWEEASAATAAAADPTNAATGADRAGEADRFQAWIAGEAGWVRRTRGLLAGAGIPRENSSFMGYWKLGQAQSG